MCSDVLLVVMRSPLLATCRVLGSCAVFIPLDKCAETFRYGSDVQRWSNGSVQSRGVKGLGKDQVINLN